MSLVDIAQWHADQGFYVVPLHGKRALTRWGKETRDYSRHVPVIQNYFSDEYTYTDRVTGEEITTVANGIGLILEPSNTVVLDLDSTDAIAWASKMSKSERWPFLQAPQISSPRQGGGLHLYFKQNPNRERLKQAHGQLHPQVDLKADGSLVVAAGSMHKSGRVYKVKKNIENLN